MQYLVTVYDHKDVLEKRLAVRDEHLVRMKKAKANGNLISGAAILDGDKMVGSTLFVEFENDKDFLHWLEEEPYIKSGVWDMQSFKKTSIKVANI